MHLINTILAADEVDLSGLESSLQAKTGIKKFTNIGDLLSQNVINLIFVIIGLIFFVNIVMAGWDYMLSTGDTKKISAGTTRFINGFVGLIMTLLAYVIVRIVTNALGLNLI